MVGFLLLDLIEEKGMANDTIIIFASDIGRLDMSHSINLRGAMFTGTIRVVVYEKVNPVSMRVGTHWNNHIPANW